MKFLKSKKGMTVVEIVVALAILGLVSVGFIGFFTDSFKFKMRNQQTVSIQKVAEETMEKLKNNKGKNVIIGSDELDITPIVEGNTKLLSDDYYTYRITVNDINDVDKGSTFYDITIEVISKDNTKIVGSISSTVQVNDANAGDAEEKGNISVKYWNEDILFKEETVIRGEYFITLQMPSKEGYVFDGWEYDSDSYDAGEPIDLSEIFDNEINLYAEWTEIQV